MAWAPLPPLLEAPVLQALLALLVLRALGLRAQRLQRQFPVLVLASLLCPRLLKH